MDHGRLSGTYNWEDFFLDVGGERDEAEEERQIDLCITDAASVSRAIARSRSREGDGGDDGGISTYGRDEEEDGNGLRGACHGG